MHLIEIFMLVSIIKTCYSLECYSCNVSSSTLDEDGCQGIGSLRKCAASSVCLSATYEIKSGIVRTYTTMQSCFPDMADQECAQYIKSQRDLQRTSTITPTTCYTCRTDNCNKSKLPPKNDGNTLKIGPETVIAIILSMCFAKLVVI